MCKFLLSLGSKKPTFQEEHSKKNDKRILKRSIAIMYALLLGNIALCVVQGRVMINQKRGYLIEN